MVRLPGRPAHGKGDALRVAVRPDAVHCLSAATGLRLPDPEDTPRAGALAEPQDAIPASAPAAPHDAAPEG